MSFIQDFKDFAFKGNLIDMAVGIVMGGAVAAIVKSFLDNIITPLIASHFQSSRYVVVEVWPLAQMPMGKRLI